MTIDNKSRNKRPDGESWMNRYWRPIAAMVYVAICLFDFIIAPIIFSAYSYHLKSEMLQAWVPLTLQGGGIFHVSFGAILSVSAWTRGTEKIARINNPSYEANMGYTSDYMTGDHSNPLPQIKKPLPRV